MKRIVKGRLMAESNHPELNALLASRKASMALFTDDHQPVNIYAIFRSDLNMTPGKMAAQCGHAFHLVIEEGMKNDPAGIEAYKGTGNGTKIIMYVKNQGQLLRVYDEAKSLGLVAEMVIDRGHVIEGTAFTGEPILTAIGIGPVLREVVAPITKRCTSAA